MWRIDDGEQDFSSTCRSGMTHMSKEKWKTKQIKRVVKALTINRQRRGSIPNSYTFFTTLIPTHLPNPPSIFLPTNILGRYLPNPTYMVTPTYLVATPIDPPTFKSDKERIKWWYCMKLGLVHWSKLIRTLLANVSPPPYKGIADRNWQICVLKLL